MLANIYDVQLDRNEIHVPLHIKKNYTKNIKQWYQRVSKPTFKIYGGKEYHFWTMDSLTTDIDEYLTERFAVAYFKCFFNVSSFYQYLWKAVFMFWFVLLKRYGRLIGIDQYLQILRLCLLKPYLKYIRRTHRSRGCSTRACT